MTIEKQGLSPAARLHQALLQGEQYELLADLREVTNELTKLRSSAPTPEGWLPTGGGFQTHQENPPRLDKPQFVYVYHPAYGVRFALYTEASWEDKALWVDDWHTDFQFTRPRRGWASRTVDTGMTLLDPQPTHYLPPPLSPTA